ncbi:50S ribosomal protein L5 [Patescibacteria group bacterium]|nr:50S ribosomal protein L5 [Patescibacteria group bacterium]MDE1946872.1 50S ribosomal protein L5 [Patescibacteria group bacterium]MDE2010692.1 50S ribosomal protein L5 [Patescibacteria group bacterium]MDE2232702.1 50S ribosomal protein L5 [Patescibacteria group bacterium]
MAYKTTQELNKDSFKALKEKLALKNPMQAPKLVKVAVSSGFGSTKDQKKIGLIADRLAKITGQKPATRAAKKAIATFKTRTGDPLAYQVTLRGKQMHEFLDRLIHIALPRTKDFRGLPRTAIDAMGNYTIGVKEHTIFPETADEDLKDVFGLGITIVTTSRDKKATEAFLEHLGLPLKRE